MSETGGLRPPFLLRLRRRSDMISALGETPQPTSAMTIPASHFLSNDPQVFEFTPYLHLRTPVVCVARWVVEPCGKRQHARRLTAQWRYTPEKARKLWASLKSNGAKPFAGFVD